MAAIPSIKGSVFAVVVADVAKLIGSRAIPSGPAERWLEASDRALLESEIVAAHWYDIRSYARMNALLLETVGAGDPEYLRERGRDNARRLLEGGLYAQLEYLRRSGFAYAADPRKRYEAFGRDLRLLTTISSSILNFSRWQSGPDPERRDRYVIEVSEARDFPDALGWRADGFVNEMASLQGDADLWSWQRVAPDRIVFRMQRAL